MDSYNRGYGAGIEGLGGLGSPIGTATFNNENGSIQAQAVGFYAAAYTINSGVTGIAAGTTVMSYRGGINRRMRDFTYYPETNRRWTPRTLNSHLPAAFGINLAQPSQDRTPLTA